MHFKEEKNMIMRRILVYERVRSNRMDCAAVHSTSEGHTALYLWAAHLRVLPIER